MPTSLKPLALLAYVLYTVPLFVILVAPNHQDEAIRSVLRWSVLALFIVPAFFVVGISRLRLADAKALASLAPHAEEPLTLEATASNLTVTTTSMTAVFHWSAVSVFVIDAEFAVLLATRTAPIPVTKVGSTSEEEFFAFLRHAQQYKAASAA
ncbi:hypothetical protein [Piscinibacter sp.]|uniref:hypothetical protein n=1 Tax=Sphaerotilaceae TaxID=2975441 RepID=UPI0039E46594